VGVAHAHHWPIQALGADITRHAAEGVLGSREN
jgi:hypothetical protein